MERDRDLAGTGAAVLSVTVGDLLDDVLRDYRLNEKNVKSAEQIVRLHLRPTFGAMAAARVVTSDLRRFTEARLAAGAAAATVRTGRLLSCVQPGPQGEPAEGGTDAQF